MQQLKRGSAHGHAVARREAKDRWSQNNPGGSSSTPRAYPNNPK